MRRPWYSFSSHFCMESSTFIHSQASFLLYQFKTTPGSSRPVLRIRSHPCASHFACSRRMWVSSLWLSLWLKMAQSDLCLWPSSLARSLTSSLHLNMMVLAMGRREFLSELGNSSAARRSEIRLGYSLASSDKPFLEMRSKVKGSQETDTPGLLQPSLPTSRFI